MFFRKISLTGVICKKHWIKLIISMFYYDLAFVLISLIAILCFSTMMHDSNNRIDVSLDG